MQTYFFFFFVFPTFHFRFPDFSLPFSRLFTSVFPTFVGFCKKKCFFIFSTFHFPDFFQVNIFFFHFPDFSFSRLFTSVSPTFHFRFPDFLLPFSRLFTSGSEKSGKRKWKVGKTKKKTPTNFFELEKVRKMKSRENEKSGKWKFVCMSFPSHRS